MDFQDRSIVITGGGSGIGRALAVEFARLEANVLIVGRSEATLEQTCLENPERIQFVVADITRALDRQELFSCISWQGRPIDMLVNNAGIQTEHDFANSNDQQTTGKLINAETQVNFIAPAQLSVGFVSLMVRGSMIVNVSSLLAIHPKTSSPIYCATKAALSSFSRALRNQLKSSGIQVIDVIPPLVDTKMTKGRGNGKMSPEAAAAEIADKLQKETKEIWVGRAKTVFWLNKISPKFVAFILSRA